jgi:NhaA family Na+:H+ antiporter
LFVAKTQQKIQGVVQTITRPVQEFLKLQAASGILLFACATIALVWSNSAWSHSYEQFWHTEVSFGFGSMSMSKSLLHWINDGLMVIFFFVVGLEIKREILIGELSSFRKAMLPIVAAIGGMLVPAMIYIAFTGGTEMASGWGIPMATDIAFSLGVLTVLGKRVPIQLKIFLTAFAIVDDIGAVIVIAMFYASSILWSHLAVAGVILLLLAGSNWMGVRHSLVYALLGVLLWLAFLGSGVHATVAGVLLAMTIPARSNLGKSGFMIKSRSILTKLEESDGERGHHARVRELSRAGEDFEALTQRFEHSLHPWVIFVIMPIFALANAGVVFSENPAALVSNPLAIGIILGLVIGKQIGITLFSWGAVRSGLASLPSSVTWRHIYGVSWLGGIGFTMSLFIAGLAFGPSQLMDISKIGIYVGSLAAGVGGVIILWRAPGSTKRQEE